MASEPTFLDTSGLLAYLDGDDACHSRAASCWERMIRRDDMLIMTDYVRLECWALIQRRLGGEAIETFHSILLPLCRVEVLGNEGFQKVTGQWLLTRRRALSLVDVASFDCMRRLGIRRAFAFDAHFQEQGFVTAEEPVFLG